MHNTEELFNLRELLNNYFKENSVIHHEDVDDFIDDIAFKVKKPPRVVTHTLHLELKSKVSLEFMGTKKQLKFIVSCLSYSLNIEKVQIESVDPQESSWDFVPLNPYDGTETNLNKIYELIDNA